MSAPDLKAEILATLEGSTSQRPLSTHTIIEKTHRQRGRVEAALMELYQARVVCCCKIAKHTSVQVVWWVSGNVVNQTEFYGKGKQAAPKAAAAPKQQTNKKRAGRISQFSRDLIDAVKAAPGISIPALREKFSGQGIADIRINSTVCNLCNSGYLRAEGKRFQRRCYPGTKA